MNEKGHTLIELLISLAMIAGLSGSAAVLMATARSDDAATQSRADELRHVRLASDLLATEIRGASEVEQGSTGLLIDGIHWTVADGELRRAGQRQVAGIALLAVERRSPRTWTVRVASVQEGAGAVARTLTTTTAQRTESVR